MSSSSDITAERPPYFLYGALAVPAIWIAYILFALLMGLLLGNHSNGDMGNWGQAMIVTFIALITSDVVGLLCSGISVARHESHRSIGFICLAIYGLPLLLAAGMTVLQLGANQGQQVMNQQHSRNQNAP
jgi:hypothetical protein